MYVEDAPIQAEWRAEEERRAAQEAAEIKQQRRLMEFKVFACSQPDYMGPWPAKCMHSNSRGSSKWMHASLRSLPSFLADCIADCMMHAVARVLASVCHDLAVFMLGSAGDVVNLLAIYR